MMFSPRGKVLANRCGKSTEHGRQFNVSVPGATVFDSYQVGAWCVKMRKREWTTDPADFIKPEPLDVSTVETVPAGREQHGVGGTTPDFTRPAATAGARSWVTCRRHVAASEI